MKKNSKEETKSKEERYQKALSKIKCVLRKETDRVLMMATISALLNNEFDYFSWVGFYRLTGVRLLSVGPYQGELGCLHITFERGVCGACARTEKTVIVPDVTKFPGHIACDGGTKSEIVIPVFDDRHRLIAVLDIDSRQAAAFDEVDGEYLEKIVKIFQKR